MEDKISIIIPIYNVEKYLSECIESVLNQTYDNTEIILVDDGSPDNCGIICDEYAKKDNRIKVIHKKNGGLSDARNVGIDIATGEYILFIDSDDYVENTYIEKLYNAIKLNNVSVSQCNISKVNNKKEILEKIGYKNNQIKSGKEMIYDIYNQHWTENVVVWDKMYSIELFKNLKYPLGKIHEDEFVTYKILYNVDKVAIIDNYLYNYRQTNESIMRKKFKKNRLNALEAFKERLYFFKVRSEKKLYILTLKCYLEQIRSAYINSKLYIRKSKDIQKKLLKEYRSYWHEFININEINKKEKIKMSMFYVMPNVFYIIKKREYK